MSSNRSDRKCQHLWGDCIPIQIFDRSSLKHILQDVNLAHEFWIKLHQRNIHKFLLFDSGVAGEGEVYSHEFGIEKIRIFEFVKELFLFLGLLAI